MSVRCWFPILCALLCAASAPAQTATLLKDINTTTDGSYSSGPHGLVNSNGIGYFFAASSPNVEGLWRTNGTGAGTYLVRDHLSGHHLTASGGKLFFIGNDGIYGNELWTSDGTPAGTVLVKDIEPGPIAGVSSDHSILAVDGTVFFVSGGFPGDLTLWRSDGTAAGSVPLLTVDPDLPSAIGLLGVFDGVAYFYANDGVNGSEFWRSDGTVAGTVMVRDIRPGGESSFVRGIVELDGAMYFTANDGVHGYELWKSDGTMAGTSLAVDLRPGQDGAFANEFLSRIAAGNRLYFAADNGGGIGLWKSDGTETGTELVYASLEPEDLTVVGNLVYFIVDAGFEQPSVLWKTDGTTIGTEPIQEFASINSFPASFAGSLFFFASDAAQGNALWKSNGTLAGTVLVKEINAAGSASPAGFAMLRANAFVSGTLVFTADDGVHGRELWKSNGSAVGTVLVKDIGVEEGGSHPSDFVSSGNELFFTALDDTGGRAQWKTNGTEEGTIPIADGTPTGPPRHYAFDDGIHGRELWMTDGTEAGTKLLKDINPGPDDGLAQEPEMLLIGETLFFPADDGVNGRELWRSDGTPSGTVMVRDIHAPAGYDSNPRALADLNGVLIFSALSGQSSNELWRSDGTESGTALVQDLRLKAPTGALFGERVVSSGLLFFIAVGPTTGHDLWRTDGTTEGTIFLQNLGGYFFQPTPHLADIDGTLFVTSHTALSESTAIQNMLGTSDGTAEGTRLLKTFDPIRDLSDPISQLTSYLGTLHFLVQTPTGQRELWKSDGTESGTIRALELPAQTMSVGSLLGSHAGSLFLSVREGVGEHSLVHVARTQGTTDTTDIGDQSFLDIAGATTAGSNLFFVGTTEETGTELWALPLLPSISANGVVDAAGYQPTLAPGSLASLFGVELSGETAAATGFPLPTTLGGAKVKVNGIDAPLLFVSPTQINFQVPYNTPLGDGVSVVAWLNGQQSLSEPTAVAEFAPAIFANPTTGEPIVQRHAEGSLITAESPAQPGDTLVIYVTGIGGLDNPPPTGAVATDAPLAAATTTPTVLIGGVEATVLFAGLAPDFAGLGQINIVLPQGLPQGTPLPLTIRFGDNESPVMELPF